MDELDLSNMTPEIYVQVLEIRKFIDETTKELALLRLEVSIPEDIERVDKLIEKNNELNMKLKTLEF